MEREESGMKWPLGWTWQDQHEVVLFNTHVDMPVKCDVWALPWGPDIPQPTESPKAQILPRNVILHQKEPGLLRETADSRFGAGYV